MQTNRPIKPDRFTHEGAPAKRINALAELRRSVLSCLLWEREFYEDGVDIAARIACLVEKVPTSDVAALAIEAREQQHLRHAPLWLVRAMARLGRPQTGQTLASVIQRPDEITEFLSIYWKEGRQPLSAQVKKGLAGAFRKFSAYQLAKYDRPSHVKLRDALFLCHAKPRDAEQAETWKKLIAGDLAAPDTWEVALSGGADKKEAFERLLRKEKIGYLALLRNLRNMVEAGVEESRIIAAILARKGASRVLPFRYIAAARACPSMEPWLDQAMGAEQLANGPVLDGLVTIVLVDVSASMTWGISARGTLNRIDAASALAVLVQGRKRVFSFSEQLVEVPPREGMAGIDAIKTSQHNGGTFLGAAVKALNTLPHDRLIVITDEQSIDPVPDPVAKRAYMINVASTQNGIGYGRWTHIDGWSDSVIRWITAYEAERG